MSLSSNASLGQDKWAQALVTAWQKDSTLAVALLLAFDVSPGVVVTGEGWEKMQAATENLVPSAKRGVYGGQRVRQWIAANAFFANNALWDGQFTKAVRLMAKGGVRKKSRRAVGFGYNDTYKSSKSSKSSTHDKKRNQGACS